MKTGKRPGATKPDIVVPVVRVVVVAGRAGHPVRRVVPRAVLGPAPLEGRTAKHPFAQAIGVAVGGVADPALDSWVNICHINSTEPVQCLPLFEFASHAQHIAFVQQSMALKNPKTKEFDTVADTIDTALAQMQPESQSRQIIFHLG